MDHDEHNLDELDNEEALLDPTLFGSLGGDDEDDLADDEDAVTDDLDEEDEEEEETFDELDLLAQEEDEDGLDYGFGEEDDY